MLCWLSGFGHGLTGFRLQALNGKADCCFGRLGQVLLVFDLAKFKLAGFRFRALVKLQAGYGLTGFFRLHAGWVFVGNREKGKGSNNATQRPFVFTFDSLFIATNKTVFVSSPIPSFPILVLLRFQVDLP
ncbi:unnamed protein product [Vicia faba]|uniref:Uncharacterized protein n=1 Tax=Vicia faba TaxID=3906 RepID=A0AAV1AYT7_VICFA|nr:unnamed protein product [Vicia faba]